MSEHGMTLRAVATFAVVAILGLGGLAVAGALDQRNTAFSLNVENEKSVISLAPGQRACQGAVPARARFQGIELWVAQVTGSGAMLRASAISADGLQLASGAVQVRPTVYSSERVRLDRAVPQGRTVALCFDNAGPASLLVQGSDARPGFPVLRQNGRTLDASAALLLERSQPTSVLSLLPTVFERAALFKPTWMGPWTYWLLLAGLLSAFPIAAYALRLAVRADTGA